MFSENLKKLRKQNGYSQENLASRLHVVRQTVSKWEKGLSVPDAEMLIKIAEIFEISVSELLGAKIEDEASTSEIARQLADINEQLAEKNRRGRFVLKIIFGIIIGIVVLNLLLIVGNIVSFDAYKNNRNIIITEQTEIVEP